MIGIVDYGVGNLFSLACSLQSLGAETKLCKTPEELDEMERAILPGVGAFGDAWAKLAQGGMDEAVRAFADAGKPLMGICLGMQLLLTGSEEFGWHEGLSLLPGRVTAMAPRLPEGLKVPQIGWNALQLRESAHPLFAKTREGDCMYFVHSFSAVDCGDALLAETEYGIPVTAAVGRGNVVGCQFHPEKSGEAGLRLLSAFLAM